MPKLMVLWLLQNWIDLRDVSFTSALYNGNIDFVCCDNPSANKLTIQILSVAENEAEMISVRTKETLAIKN
jgi:hypothetical protein